MNKPLKIYIAGPYTAETEAERVKNVNAAIDASFVLFSQGHYPYIPHLTHFIDQRAKQVKFKMEWHDYIRWDLVWLEFCDALLYLGSSRGADLELTAAREAGKEIFYSLEEVPALDGEHSESPALQGPSSLGTMSSEATG
jgi:uncharacterized protein DUF4406